MNPARGRALPLGLAAFAFVLALLQRPGRASSDTKIDLHVDPGGFLGEVAAMWADSGGLGQVQAGQYAGYLWPMGPFFALGDLLGLPAWLVHRLWLGALLALAAWGVVRLLDVLLSPQRGVAHALAGVLFVLNPYTVVFANRTSITLLGYALLPWLLLVVVRGARESGRWRWPAAFALLVTSTGGGVNAAVTGWLLLGPLLLLAYEWRFGGVPGRDALRLLGRCALLSLPVCAWWLVPTAIHAGYGINFLPFTESAGAIWTTTSLTESLRLMGYWISYLGIGFGAGEVPYFSDSGVLLFNPAVVLATLLVPALALGGFVWTRRWHYGPFLLALALLALLVMMAGYPEGAPLRRSLVNVYEHVEAVQFLRTTYKAGPLLALALACLAGAAAGQLWPRIARSRVRVAAAGAAAILIALSAWPLVRGQAVDERVTWDEIPSAWRQAAADLERELPRGQRALVLPGQLFGFYRWGGTVDPILPTLSERPVSQRTITPYSDLHAAELLWALDELVEQERALPGQLRPLLGLLGAGAVVSASDDDRLRSGAIAPADAAGVLAELGAPARSYGERKRFQPAGLGEPIALPQVRRYDLAASDGLIRLARAGSETIVDGSGEGVVAAAALGRLRPPLIYAAHATPAQLRDAREIVITDSNRRRIYVSSTLRQSRGAVLAAGERLPPESAFLSPLERSDSDAQTVALYKGARYLRTPAAAAFAQYPEHRPFAAFDGDPATYWLADHNLRQQLHWLEIGFESRRDVAAIELLPARVGLTRVTEVEVAGRRFALRRGWNRLELGLRGVRELRVRISGYERRARLDPSPAIAEIRIPGVKLREALRPPVVAERALARGAGETGDSPARAAGAAGGTPARGIGDAGLSYIFTRVTGDRPFRRGRAAGRPAQATVLRRGLDAAFLANPDDPERRLRRSFAPPAARAFALDGWASADPRAPDRALDELIGYRGGILMDSSSRYEGVPGRRASGAFDGDPATAWIGDWNGKSRPWIEWSRPRPTPVRRLKLRPAAEPVRFPTRVRVTTDRATETATVRAGAVELRRPVETSVVRIEILAARPPAGVEVARRRGNAVGIAAIEGLPAARVPRAGELPRKCRAVELSAVGRRVRLRAGGGRLAFDRGDPVRVESCDGPLRLPAAPVLLEDSGGPLRLHTLRLASPSRRATTAASGGRVLDPGSSDHGERDHVRLQVNAPSWLILGEAHNKGWKATCDGRDLGEPAVVDGYANGWHVRPGCRSASFSFEPNRWARIAFAISAAAAVLLLILLAASRAGGTSISRAPLAGDAGMRRDRTRAPRALAVGFLLTPPLAFLFSIRAGIVLGPLVALVLWRGWGAARLTAIAAALLGIAVPAVYLLFEPEDGGGFNSEYAQDLLGAHWIGVGAYVLLALALLRSLRRAPLR